MKRKKPGSTHIKKLRNCAEKTPAKKKINGIHKLRAYQIELEAQNESLRRIQAKIESAQDKYLELYDFSPIGYLTLDKNGFILEANFSASKLFNMDKKHLIKSRFVFFVASEHRYAFKAFLKQVFASESKQICEIKLIDNKNQPVYAHIESVRMNKGKGEKMFCQTAIVDISKRKDIEDAVDRARDDLEVRMQRRTFELARSNTALKEEINKYKDAQVEITKLNKQMEFVLGATKTGLDIIDSDYNMIYIDPEWQKVYGDPKEKKCYEYFMGRSNACPDCGVAKAFKTKKAVVAEEILAKEGGRSVQVTTIPFQDEKNNWLVAEINVDITERKKKEEELLLKTTLLEGQTETMIDGILVVDDNGKVISFNKNFSLLWKIPKKLLDTRDDASLIEYALSQLKYPDSFIAEVKRLYLNKDEKSRDEIEFKDGRFFDRYSSPLIDSIGNYRGRIWFFRDISERKKSEKRIYMLNQLQIALLDAGTLEEKLKRITDSVVDIFNADFSRIWLMRPGDRCNSGCFHAAVMEGPHRCLNRGKCLHLVSSSGRYKHIDGNVHSRVPFGCYKIGGIASGEYTSFLTNDVAHDARVHSHEWAKQIGLVSFAGFQLRSPNSETLGVLALFSQHPISQEEYIMLHIISNVVVRSIQAAIAEKDRVQAEENLKNTLEKLKEMHLQLIQSAKMAAIGTLSTGVAHEIDNPLMGAILLSENLMSGKEKGTKEYETLSQIDRGLKQIADIISKLMKFSKKEQVIFKKRSINKVIDLSILLILHEFELNEIELIKSYGEDLPDVEISINEMQQVLINILLNARDASLYSDIKQVTITTYLEDDMVKISIKDKGCGIEKKYLDKLFVPFFTTKPGGKGLGMGLPVSKDIMNEHHGKIEVHSEEKEGTEVILSLPKTKYNI